MIKYLLDENVDPLYRTQLPLRIGEPVVWWVGLPSTPPNGSPDPEILQWCEIRKFFLVTNNRHSMPVHLKRHLEAGRHVPGIIQLNPKLSVGDNIAQLRLIWELGDENDYLDSIKYLSTR